MKSDVMGSKCVRPGPALTCSKSASSKSPLAHTNGFAGMEQSQKMRFGARCGGFAQRAVRRASCCVILQHAASGPQFRPGQSLLASSKQSDKRLRWPGCKVFTFATQPPWGGLPSLCTCSFGRRLRACVLRGFSGKCPPSRSQCSEMLEIPKCQDQRKKKKSVWRVFLKTKLRARRGRI